MMIYTGGTTQEKEALLIHHGTTHTSTYTDDNSSGISILVNYIPTVLAPVLPRERTEEAHSTTGKETSVQAETAETRAVACGVMHYVNSEADGFTGMIKAR